MIPARTTTGRRNALRLALATLLVGAASMGAHTAHARLETGRYPFEVGRWIHLTMELGDVRVEDIKFHRPVKWKGVLLRHDKPNRATIVVRNTGAERLDVGVAVAVFREDGTLIAAGNSGPTLGVLQPGERHELDIAFHSVWREIDQGDYFLITAEY